MVQVDIDKLVEWPGFNSELPRQFRDDTSRLRVRRRSKTESLRQMKEKLRPQEQKVNTDFSWSIYINTLF